MVQTGNRSGITYNAACVFRITREGVKFSYARRHKDYEFFQPIVLTCAVLRRHSSAGANPARQLSLQPVAVGAGEGGNEFV